MRRDGLCAGLAGLALLLLVVLYPVFFLGQQVAPESALKGVPPWRAQSGPLPAPPRIAIEAATTLGPRLQSLARDGLDVALWNPWIGGGRAGWFATPQEGGAPLVVLASLAAARGSVWTALLVLEIAAAFVTCFWIVRRLGNEPGPSLVGASLYALAGPVTAHWLDWQGSAMALGPLAFAPALLRSPIPLRRFAAWGSALVVLLACGPPAIPFVALGIAFALIGSESDSKARMHLIALVAVAAIAAAAVRLPSTWLERAGAEPGSPPRISTPTSPRATLSSLVTGAPVPDAVSAARSNAPTPSADRDGLYVGTLALVLALFGIAVLPPTQRAFWGAMLSATLLLSFAPSRWLGDGWLAVRPAALLAFVIAVLAAAGAAALVRVLPERARPVVALAMCALACARLLPVASRHIIFADRLDLQLQSPLPDIVGRGDSRAVTLLDALPPDVAGTLRYPDARAASLSAEPRYAAILSLGAGGQLPVSRVFDPEFPRTGVRWILEPSTVSLVSGEIFSRIEQTEGERFSPAGSTGARFAVAIPEGACRLGVRGLGATDTSVTLHASGEDVKLVADTALSPESDVWLWYSLPPNTRAGPAMLVVRGTTALASRLPIAWDRSALRLHSEGQGLRVWRYDLARAFAYLAVPVPGTAAVATTAPIAGTVHAPGRVVIEQTSAGRYTFRVESPTPARLVVAVKYRPMLWRTRIDGRAAVTQSVDGVWTAIPVGTGTSTVVLEARIPKWAWLVACLGACSILVASVMRRRR